MSTPTRLRRALIAAAGAALLTVGVAGAGVASGGGSANPNGGAPGPDRTAVSAIFPAGSELQFVAVAPCRILDTRVAGGMLSNAARVFTATAPYAAQGGNAAGCNILTSAVSLQLNVGAVSQLQTAGFVKGWATGTSEPNASLVNYDPSGPVANMVTVPLSASHQFTLKTNKSAHLFADVAGFYVKPLYAMVTPTGAVYQGKASGVVSITHPSVGRFDVQFDRDVQNCSVQGSSGTWATNIDVSPDNQNSRPVDTVLVGLADTNNAPVDEYFYLTLTC